MNLQGKGEVLFPPCELHSPLGYFTHRMSSVCVETVAFIALWVKQNQTTCGGSWLHKHWEPLTYRGESGDALLRRRHLEKSPFLPPENLIEGQTCLGYSVLCANGPWFSPHLIKHKIWKYLIKSIGNPWILVSSCSLSFQKHLQSASAALTISSLGFFSHLTACLFPSPLCWPLAGCLTKAGSPELGPGPRLLYVTLPCWWLHPRP